MPHLGSVLKYRSYYRNIHGDQSLNRIHIRSGMPEPRVQRVQVHLMPFVGAMRVQPMGAPGAQSA